MNATERGSGTIWTIAIACFVIFAAGLTANLTAVMSATRRADVAADLAALSALGSNCTRAAAVATAHNARLIDCQTVETPNYGTTVEVTTEIRTHPIFGHVFTLRSRARAGWSTPPVPAG